ncbi:hypothetical protein V2O64_07745 [Verrucomicrobiaceae bacterium 227]
MKTNFAILIAVISLLLGFFFRNAMEPPVPVSDQAPAVAERSSSIRMISSQRRSLGETMKIPESTQRWLRTVALLENAKLSQMRGIAESIGYSDKRVTTLVAQRWLELDPQHFFETCLLEIERTPTGRSATFACFDFIEFLAKEWPQHDFKAALKAFSRPDPKSHLAEAKGEFLNSLVKVDLDKAIKTTREWDGFGIWGSGIAYLREAAENDPEGIARTIFTYYDTNSEKNETGSFPRDQSSPEGSRFINTVAKVWGESDAIAALAFADSRQNDQGEYLRDQVVEAWLKKDRAAAGQWLEGQEIEIQEKYRPLLIQAWAIKDPQGALAWCIENLQDPDTYSANVRTLAYAAVQGDLGQAIDLVPALEDEYLQVEITSEIARRWFTPDSGQISEEAVDWLRDLGGSRFGKSAMNRAMEGWAKNDPDGLKVFLEEERDFEYSPAVYDKVIEALTNRDPVEALEWGSRLGDHSESHLKTASQVWISQRPEVAIDWLRGSPDNSTAEAAMRLTLAETMAKSEGAERLRQKLGSENQFWLETQFRSER